MFLPARPPLRRPLFPLRKGRARRQSLDSGLAVLPSAPDSPYQQRCFPERHVKAPMRLCRRPSGLARLPDESGYGPVPDGYSERLMSPAGSPFYSDASEPLMRRTAAALARFLVEHYGSLSRAFRAITREGQMSLMDWEQELVPLQEHLEECSGRSLREIFEQIQALEKSELQISYDTWWQFFQDCLHDSHSEHLLCQDLGPRETQTRPVAEEELTSNDPSACQAPLNSAPETAVAGPSFGGPLKSLMSRQQVETELRRRYSSSGALGFSRIPLLPIQVPL
mmetsp:Transcript_61359/g.100294  ORF Transcript_61359/g.100294 Transcript_61359/m.100294 type:complete len:281 (-) Transcript_61359:123-965(-)